MEERDFLLDLCLAVLSADKGVRFAGVIDNSGKLLVGKYRQNIQSPLIVSTSLTDPNGNSFYSGYLALSINRRFERELGELHFQLTEFDKVRLVTIPLTDRSDRYLCISLDSEAQYQQIISKILDNI